MKLLSKLRKITRNQYILFIWALLLLMLPNILFQIVTPTGINYLILSLLLPLSFYTLLLTIAFKPGYGIIFLFPIFLINGLQLSLFYLFGNEIISTDMILNLFTPAHNNEGKELVSAIWPVILIFSTLYITPLFLAIISIRSNNQLSDKLIKNSRIIANTVIASIFLITIMAANPTGLTKTFTSIYPFNAIHNFYRATTYYYEIKDFKRCTQNFDYQATKTNKAKQREVYIAVIGETSRAENWQLFGYNRPTNPLLSQRKDLILFNHVLSTSNITHRMVPLLLSTVMADGIEMLTQQKSILSAFDQVGFETYFITTQPIDESLVHTYSTEAKHYIETQFTNDCALINTLQEILKNNPNNLFIVFHTYGSHFEYDKRYNKADARFLPDKGNRLNIRYKDAYKNSYDNTILNTDKLLDGLIEAVKADSSCAALCYVSDHGEDLMDDYRGMTLHSSITPTYHQLHVPMLYWFSPQYQKEFPNNIIEAYKHQNSVFNNDIFAQSLLHIAQIKTPYLHPSYAITDPQFHPLILHFLTDFDHSTPLQNLPLNTLDKKKLSQNGFSLK